jgi:hypothetical protein
MKISKMTRRRGREPKIMVAEALLTVLLAKDNGHYCAKCPELAGCGKTLEFSCSVE